MKHRTTRARRVFWRFTYNQGC